MTRVVVLLMVTVAALLVSAAGAPGAARSPRGSACHWQQRYRATLAGLGADLRVWFVDDTRGGHYGYTYPAGYVEVSPRTPCRMVPDVVRHEWMHLQMLHAPRPEPRREELVAGCGSLLLGSDATPAVDRARQRGVDRPCSGVVRRLALRLIRRGDAT